MASRTPASPAAGTVSSTAGTKGSLDIYMIAVGGTGMAPLACLLAGAGHRVRGADGPLYPPMSELLAAAGIRPHVGFDAAHLSPAPDLVVVGNAVPRTNPEAEAVERSGVERISMPEALTRFFFSGRKSLVVAGTHGKTTTTALAAHLWHTAGRDPGYLIGGWPLDLPASFHQGTGERFIVEGDEYNAAYFDRGAKFLHYRAETLILTSAEYDHADLYQRPEDLTAAFRQLIAQLPADGLLVACGDSSAVRELAARAPCRTVLYGLTPGNDLRPLADPEFGPHETSFEIADPEAGRIHLRLQLAGRHNVANALAVWAAARAEGLPADQAAAALSSFRGVRRRLETIGEATGVVVVDDFAHHPTAVAATLAALRQRFPDRRVTALFEPRSLTAGRAFFHAAYRGAFREADRVLFAPIFHAGRLGEEERLDLDRLAGELVEAGTAAIVCGSNEELLHAAIEMLEPGTVAVTMSSGSFDGMPRRLLQALADKEGSEQTEPSQSRLEQPLLE